MNRSEQAELAELIVRTVNMAVTATRVLYADNPDMGDWVSSDEAYQQARRETWECLYRIVTTEDRQETKSHAGIRVPRQPAVTPS